MDEKPGIRSVLKSFMVLSWSKLRIYGIFYFPVLRLSGRDNLILRLRTRVFLLSLLAWIQEPPSPILNDSFRHPALLMHLRSVVRLN